jgi:GNAT superfamily N-acetyltransferase
MPVQFSYLADQPELVPQIIRWWHTVWTDRMGSDFSSLEQQLADSLSKTEFPIHIIASIDAVPVAVAALKRQELVELFPDKQYWLGSVYVDENWRGRKLGSQITAHAIELAREKGLPHLYLQTQNLSGGLYTKLGWQAIEQLSVRGDPTLLMVLTLSETQ